MAQPGPRCRAARGARAVSSSEPQKHTLPSAPVSSVEEDACVDTASLSSLNSSPRGATHRGRVLGTGERRLDPVLGYDTHTPCGTAEGRVQQ